MMQTALGNLSCQASATGVNNSALLSPGKKNQQAVWLDPWGHGGQLDPSRRLFHIMKIVKLLAACEAYKL